MKLRILVIKSLSHGVIGEDVESRKDDLIKYLNNMIMKDAEAYPDEYPPLDKRREGVSLIPIIMTKDAWKFMRSQIIMSPNLNDVYANRILDVVNNQIGVFSSTTSNDKTELILFTFVFPAEFSLDEKYISNKVLDSVSDLLDKMNHKIDEMSFTILEELEEIDDKPEEILYN